MTERLYVLRFAMVKSADCQPTEQAGYYIVPGKVIGPGSFRGRLGEDLFKTYSEAEDYYNAQRAAEEANVQV